MTNISEKISNLRKERKLTQEQLGELLGITGQAVSKWENGTSLPDIMLLPKLCNVLGISADELLEMPVEIKNRNVILDFCAYARENGRTKSVCDIICCLFNDVGNVNKGKNVSFSSDSILVSDGRGMGFVMTGENIKGDYLSMKSEDIAGFLQILCDPVVMDVIKVIKCDDAITSEEISSATGIETGEVERILFKLLTRNIVAFGVDDRGKRGYLQSANMVGVWMILSGCSISACGGEGSGSFWISRK